MMRIAVLMGGWSGEREVSLVTGQAAAESLERNGHDVFSIDVQPQLKDLLAALDLPPDVAFNGLHGKFGEDGGIQAILNGLRIPYTHSGMVASALGILILLTTTAARMAHWLFSRGLLAKTRKWRYR